MLIEFYRSAITQAALKSQLRGFLSFCLRHLRISKVWRRALVTISKPSKLREDPMNDCPISLLCVPYKILERLIKACVKPLSVHCSCWAGLILTWEFNRGSISFAYPKHWGLFWSKKRQCRVSRSDSGLWHCLALLPHLQAAQTIIGNRPTRSGLNPKIQARIRPESKTDFKLYTAWKSPKVRLIRNGCQGRSLRDAIL